MRLSILAAMIMLVAGVGMISGYFGGMPDSAVLATSTPGATSEARPPAENLPGTPTNLAVHATATGDAPGTEVAAQSPVVEVQVTNTARAIAQATPISQVSAITGVGSSNMATAMAVEAQSTAVAQASALAATSTAQVVAQLTVSAAGTAQAISNTNADETATAVTAATAAQIAASQQTQQAQQAQQAQQTQEAQQAQPTVTSVVLSVIFEDDYYRGIDIWAATREQFGAKAVLYSKCEGLNCWYVKSGAQVKALDLKRAVTKQYGADWTLVAIGAGKSDWRAVRFSDLSYAVLPVMMVSADRLTDVAGVNTGLARFRTVLVNSQYWYYAHVGKTFRLLQPVIVTTDQTSAQWNNLSGMYTNKDKLAQAALSQYSKQLPAPGNDLRVVIAPYTGENYTIAQGALSMPGFAVAPALATSLWCPQSGQLDKQCQSAAYLVGQALGLSFGLGHSCAVYPRDRNCRVSLMQEGKPPSAMLLQPEVKTLEKSPFFTRY